MSRGFILIDGSNISYAASAGKPLSVGDQPTQGVYGFIRSIRVTIDMFPQLTPIVLWDGISWRLDRFPEYKASRNKPVETKADIEQNRIRVAVKSQALLIRQALKLLGVRQIIAANMEADDLAGIMVARYEKDKSILMISGDKDWIQLIGPKCSWFDTIRDRRVSPRTLKEKYGVDTPRQFLDLKALTGDKSDEIPGVGGIGELGAIELVNKFGSVSEFLNRYHLDPTLDQQSLPKKFRDFADDDEKILIYRRNMMLMDLRTKDRPQPHGFKVVHSKLDKPNFEIFCGNLLFKSILTDLDKWLKPFEGI